MKVDEKHLDRLEEELKGPYFSDGRVGLHIAETKELVRLARLGLWAESHALPALKKISGNKTMQVMDYSQEFMEGSHEAFQRQAEYADDALEKLKL